MTADEPRMMHIGDLAEKTGLSLRTIRHYDEVGILRPSGRSEGGFRLYTEDDLARLLLIRRMKPLGFSLEQMGDLLKIIDSLNGPLADPERREVRAQLGTFIADARDRRQRLREQLAMADEFLELLQRQ